LPADLQAATNDGMVMDEQDLEPLTKRQKPKDLDVMSVEALKEYIAGLEAEIERARGAIAAKQSHKAAAESFFKK
jgi:uncharacterized small protein (DUF1192 family)